MSQHSVDTGASKKEKKDFVDQPDGCPYIPIVVDKAPDSKLDTLALRRFFVTSGLKVVQFQFKIRNMLSLPPEQCLFLYTDNYKVWEPSTTFGELYEYFGRKHVKLKYTDENLYGTKVYKNMDNPLLPPLPL